MPNDSSQTSRRLWPERAKDTSVIFLWVTATCTMVFYNKFLLSVLGFAFPITLTMWHMMVCSALAVGCVWCGVVESLTIPLGVYVRRVLPIAACYAGSLWTSNAAYAACSISFIQMIKAGMPVMVFLLGTVVGTECFSLALLADVSLITVGVAVAALGEVNLVISGLLLLLTSMLLDATRLTLTQHMLQNTAIHFNPITTLYYVAPPAAAFLSVPCMLMEADGAWNFLDTHRQLLWHFPLNGLTAVGLNLAVYLLIGRTSALTMNVCGLVKDWFTISVSVVLFGSVVTRTNILGYSMSFVGVCWYNYLRAQQRQEQQKQHLGVANTVIGDAEAQIALLRTGKAGRQ